jgi:hypothetical protein
VVSVAVLVAKPAHFVSKLSPLDFAGDGDRLPGELDNSLVRTDSCFFSS